MGHWISWLEIENLAILSMVGVDRSGDVWGNRWRWWLATPSEPPQWHCDPRTIHFCRQPRSPASLTSWMSPIRPTPSTTSMFLIFQLRSTTLIIRYVSFFFRFLNYFFPPEYCWKSKGPRNIWFRIGGSISLAKGRHLFLNFVFISLFRSMPLTEKDGPTYSVFTLLDCNLLTSFYSLRLLDYILFANIFFLVKWFK